MTSSSTPVIAVNSFAAALLGALSAQVLHEAFHGIMAVLVGGEWIAFNLFAVLWGWPHGPNEVGTLLVEGTPALVNILAGALSVYLFGLAARKNRTMLALFLLYFAGYNLFMGFGYLLVDSAFFSHGDDQVGDWQKVIHILGGSVAVRFFFGLVGAAGVLWGFFWVARSTLRFVVDFENKSERVRVALMTLLVPYLAVNSVVTLLAFWHPLGIQGMALVALQYWFGYVGYLWGFFLAGYWLDKKPSGVGPLETPSGRQPAWWALAFVGLVMAIGLVLPTPL